MGNGIERAGAQTRPIDTKVQVKLGAGAHFDQSSAGGGVNLRVDKNFKLNESIYLKGTAGAEIYSNTRGADLGIELRTAKGNITPALGAEVQYRQSGINKLIVDEKSTITDGESIKEFYDTSITEYRKDWINTNLKAGLEGTTNNGRFTAGAGIKFGANFDLKDPATVTNDVQVSMPQNDEFATKLEELCDKLGAQTRAAAPMPELNTRIAIIVEGPAEGKHLPEHMNLSGYAHAEYKLGKGLSVFANGEFGNKVKEGTVGIRYTF